MIPFLSNLTKRLSFFAKVGALGGALFGILFKRCQDLFPNMTWIETFEAAVLLSIFAWLCMLLLFGIWLRYTIKQIWVQTFLVSIMTCMVTACILHLFFTFYAGLLGLILGIIIGTILNMLCHSVFCRRGVEA